MNRRLLSAVAILLTCLAEGPGLPPADQRPRTILRFADQPDLLVSGLLNGGGDVAGRPTLIDVPLDKGHVVLFSFNPIYRGGTEGSYPLMLNAILHCDSLGAGRSGLSA